MLYIGPGSVVQSDPSADGDWALIISVIVVLILGGLLVVLLGAAMQAESKSSSETDADERD